MQVKLSELPALLEAIIESTRKRGIETVNLNSIDGYWIVQPPEWTDFQKQPDISVGSLSDDWIELSKLTSGRMPTPVDLDRLAAVLRALSACIAPPK